MDAARYLALLKSRWWLLLHRMVIAAGTYAPTYGLPGAAPNSKESGPRIGLVKPGGRAAGADPSARGEAELRPMERRAG